MARYRNDSGAQLILTDLSLHLQPGAVSDDIPENLAVQSAAFINLRTKNLLVAINAPIAQQQTLSASETGLDSQLQVQVKEQEGKIIFAAPDGNQTPYRADSVKTVSAVEPAPTNPPQNVVVASRDDMGAFITKDKKNPLGGEELSTAKFIEKKSQSLSQSADELLRAGLPERFPKTDEDDLSQIPKTIPEDLQEWFGMRHTQKKFVVLSSTDKKFLEKIKQHDTNEKVRALIDQRIQELSVKPNHAQHVDDLLKFKRQ